MAAPTGTPPSPSVGGPWTALARSLTSQGAQLAVPTSLAEVIASRSQIIAAIQADPPFARCEEIFEAISTQALAGARYSHRRGIHASYRAFMADLGLSTHPIDGRRMVLYFASRVDPAAFDLEGVTDWSTSTLRLYARALRDLANVSTSGGLDNQCPWIRLQLDIVQQYRSDGVKKKTIVQAPSKRVAIDSDSDEDEDELDPDVESETESELELDGGVLKFHVFPPPSASPPSSDGLPGHAMPSTLDELLLRLDKVIQHLRRQPLDRAAEISRAVCAEAARGIQHKHASLEKSQDAIDRLDAYQENLRHFGISEFPVSTLKLALHLGRSVHPDLGNRTVKGLSAQTYDLTTGTLLRLARAMADSAGEPDIDLNHPLLIDIRRACTELWVPRVRKPRLTYKRPRLESSSNVPYTPTALAVDILTTLIGPEDVQPLASETHEDVYAGLAELRRSWQRSD